MNSAIRRRFPIFFTYRERSGRDVMLTALFGLLSLVCLAQEVTTIGFPANGIFHGSGVDTVNVQNGNLHIEIPLWSVKGRNGLTLAYKYVYDNFGWYIWTHCSPQGYCTAQIRTETYNHLTLTVVSPFTSSFVTGYQIYQPCSNQNWLTVNNRFVHDADGTAHHVLPDPYLVGSGSPTCFPSTAFPAYADDGSGWVATGLQNATSKDGTSLSFTTCADGTPNATVTDTNGNQLNAPCSFGNVTDTAGHSTPSNGLSYYDSSGTLRTIQVQTTPVNVHTRLCQYSGADTCAEYTGTWNVPGQITLPNGMTYVFNYTSCKSGGIDFGEPCSVTLPTGGQISWTWGAVSATKEARTVATRTETANGQSFTWTYGVGASVTDPAGNQTNFVLTGFKPNVRDLYWINVATLPLYPTQAKYYQGGTLLKTVDTAYTTTGGVLPIRETTTWNPQNLVTKTETDYDGISTWSGTISFSNPIEKREYAYGTGTFGALQRKTHFNYLHLTNSTYLTKNILDLPTSKVVYDGSGTIKAQTTYTYDGTSLTSTSGTPAPNHDYTNFGSTFLTRGNVTRVSQWLNPGGTWLNTDNTYDDLGNRRSTTDPGLHATNFDYTDSWKDSACTLGANTFAYLTQMTDALSHRVQHSYYRCTGLTGASKSQNDITNGRGGTTYTYDLLDRLVTTSFPDGGSTTKSYNDSGTISSTTSQLVTSGLNIVKTTLFDGFGRTLQTQSNDPDCGGGTGLVKVDYAYGYDSVNHLQFDRVSTPYCNTPDSTYGLMTTTNHDVLDRITSVVQGDGSTTATTYSGTAAGLTTTVTDEAGKQNKSQADALGHLTAVWEDPGTLNYETDYAYDTLDNLTSVTQKAGGSSGSWRTRSFNYDSLSRLKCSASPEVTSGLNNPAVCPTTDSGTYTAGTIGYTYDSDGNVLTRTAPAPNQTGTSSTVVTSYSYDNIHRLTQKTYTGTPATPTVKYGYDAVALSGCGTTPPTISPADANPVSYRTSMCDGSGATSWSHDPMGRVFTQQEIINGSSAINSAVKYAYYGDGELNTLTYPGSSVITYSANSGGGYSAGRPVSAIDSGNSINYVTNAAYAPHGEIASLKLGASINSAFAYNSRLQPIQMFYGTNTPPVLAGISCPGTVGNIMHRTYDFRLGAGDNGNVWVIANCRDTNRTQNFTYDNLNRITQAYTSGSNWGETITIDGWGNLTNKGPVTGKINYENFNAAPASITNQLNGYCHDSAGNLVLNSGCPTGTFTPTYAYDIENRLTGTAGFTYVYDGDGKRVKKCSNAGCTSGTLYWMGSGRDTLQETDFSGNATEDYIFFNGKRIARRDASGGGVHYYVADHLDSTNIVTSSTGTIQKEADYYPYGGEITISGSDINNYKFTHQERDSESGLDNFGKRYYASATGRFSSTDPGPYVWHDPQTLNRYTYTRNNPLRYVDPTGMYFVVSAEMQAQVRQYISTMLRSPEGAAMIRAISANPKPNFFSQGQLDRHQVPGTNQIAVTNGTTMPIPGNQPGQVAGTQTTLSNSNIAFTAGMSTGSTFAVGLKAFAHEDAHVVDMNAAHTLQQAVAAGSAGDAPTRPGADNTAGGTAEGRALGVMGELGSAGQSFQANARTDAQADAIIQGGIQQFGQDQRQQINQAVQHHGCTSDSEGQHCD